MTTKKQELGEWGEDKVVKLCHCPKCKKVKTFKRLPTNFKCADLICDFCGFLAQVKTMNVKELAILPKRVLGAAWKPQKDRMDYGIYFPLYLVLKSGLKSAIYYLPTDFQTNQLFVPRKPLSEDAKRPEWQGFYYDLTTLSNNSFLRLY